MMLWIKLAIPFALAFGGAFLMSNYGGKVADLSERAGMQEQIIVQKERAIAQERQIAAEKQAELEAMQVRHQQEIQALVERQKASEQAIEEANELLTQYRAMRNENPELEIWANREHPNAITGLLNAAAGTSTPRADSSNEESVRPPTEGSD